MYIQNNWDCKNYLIRYNTLEWDEIFEIFTQCPHAIVNLNTMLNIFRNIAWPIFFSILINVFLFSITNRVFAFSILLYSITRHFKQSDINHSISNPILAIYIFLAFSLPFHLVELHMFGWLLVRYINIRRDTVDSLDYSCPIAVYLPGREK